MTGVNIIESYLHQIADYVRDTQWDKAIEVINELRSMPADSLTQFCHKDIPLGQEMEMLIASNMPFCTVLTVQNISETLIALGILNPFPCDLRALPNLDGVSRLTWSVREAVRELRKEGKLMPVSVNNRVSENEWYLSPACASVSGLVQGGKLISGMSDPAGITSATEIQSVIDKLMMHATDGKVRLVWEFRDLLVAKGLKVDGVGLRTLPTRPSMTWFDILIFRSLCSALDRGLAKMYIQHDLTCGGSYIAFAMHKVEKFEPANNLNDNTAQQFRRAGRPKSTKEENV